MSETKHSPLPWRVEGEVVVTDAEGYALFQCCGERLEAFQDAEIATKVHRAVNSHEELVAALKALLDADNRGELHRDPLDTNDLFAAAREALTKAGAL